MKDFVIDPKFADHPIFKERVFGTNFGFLSKRGYYGRDDVLIQPKLMRDMGINWVTLNMNVCQGNYFSTKQYIDFEYTAGELELYEISRALKDQGIKILFKPCLTLMDGQWMGSVAFPSVGCQIEGVSVDYWKKWFDSFSKCVRYFSALSEKLSFDGLIIGAEYFGTEGRSEDWNRMIGIAREYYGGPITYEFTPASRKQNKLEWFSALDFLSYSYYPPACPQSFIDNPEDVPNYTKDEMKEYLSSRRSKIFEISKTYYNKPIVFTEFGVRSSHGSIVLPFNFQFSGKYDGQEQANYLQAAYEVFEDLSVWLGFFLWKWDETQNRPLYRTDSAGDKGFTLQGKPAEAVFRKLVSKYRKDKSFSNETKKEG